MTTTNVDLTNAINVINKLESFINNKCLKQFGELHNIKPEFNYLKLKKENISKTAYFLDVKKKYALHIINRENIDIDEIEIKGLAINRSDYPKLTKEKLYELLMLIIKPDVLDINNINNFINTTTNLFVKYAMEGNKCVARPVSYSTFQYKRSKPPFHVLGMQLWNTLVYNTFYPGSKGYMFRIKGIDTGKYKNSEYCKLDIFKMDQQILKSNYIVIPEDVNNIPDFFILDIDKIVEFAWLDRVKELCIFLDNSQSTDNNYILL